MSPTLKVYALCLVILFFKMTAIGIYQSNQRKKHKSFSNPEDARFFIKSEPHSIDPEPVQRGANAYRNDLESIPVFLFLALVYVMLECWETGAIIYFWTFTFARISHTVCYLKGLQPWRSMSYGIGMSISSIIAIHILVKVLT